jgi:hypothetical protein
MAKLGANFEELNEEHWKLSFEKEAKVVTLSSLFQPTMITEWPWQLRRYAWFSAR